MDELKYKKALELATGLVANSNLDMQELATIAGALRGATEFYVGCAVAEQAQDLNRLATNRLEVKISSGVIEYYERARGAIMSGMQMADKASRKIIELPQP